MHQDLRVLILATAAALSSLAAVAKPVHPTGYPEPTYQINQWRSGASRLPFHELAFVAVMEDLEDGAQAANGRNHRFPLTQIPEPDAIVLVMAGLIGVCAWGLVRRLL